MIRNVVIYKKNIKFLIYKKAYSVTFMLWISVKWVHTRDNDMT